MTAAGAPPSPPGGAPTTDGGTPSVPPRTGDPAPDLTLPDTVGTPVRLEALRGTPVLVVFLPMAFSRTCTSELRALRDHLDELEQAGARLLLVTCDAPPTLRAWAQHERLVDGTGVHLLSDFWPHGAAARAFGAFEEITGTPRRVSVLVDPHGLVRWTTEAPPGQARDISEHLAAVAAL